MDCRRAQAIRTVRRIRHWECPPNSYPCLGLLIKSTCADIVPRRGSIRASDVVVGQILRYMGYVKEE